MEQVDQILHFIKENLYDSDLPFLLSEGPRKGARQLKRKDNDGNLHEIYLFAQWKTYELEAFDTFQWQLVAPYFHLSTQLEAKILHYSLENHVILPFIEDDEIRHSGGYGDVWRIKIHPAHHNFCKDSVCFLN
jgi:hypothetical protein